MQNLKWESVRAIGGRTSPVSLVIGKGMMRHSTSGDGISGAVGSRVRPFSCAGGSHIDIYSTLVAWNVD